MLATKAKLHKEDIEFDTDGDGATSQVPTSTGGTRTGSKLNAGHIPLTTQVRQLIESGTDVEAALLYLLGKVGDPDGAATLTAAGIIRLATQDETLAGSSGSIAVSPSSLNAVVEQTVAAMVQTVSDALSSHTSNTNNPHSVTAEHVTAEQLGVAVASEILHVQEQQASGTDGHAGDTPTADDWNQRELNATVINGISGAELNNNQITLPSGTYWIEARAPAVRATNHQIRAYDVDNSATLLVGSSEYNAAGASYAQTSARLRGRIVLGGSTTIRIDHYIGYAPAAAAGFGIAVSSGAGEVYTDVFIQKLA